MPINYSKNCVIPHDDYEVVKEISKRLNCTINLVFKTLHELIIRVGGADVLNGLLDIDVKKGQSKSAGRYFDFSFLKDDSLYYRKQYYNLVRLLNNDEFEKAYNAYMLEYDNTKLIDYFYKKL